MSKKTRCQISVISPTDLIEFYPMSRLTESGWKIQTDDIDESLVATMAKAKFDSSDELHSRLRQAVLFLERYFLSAVTREFHIDATVCVERFEGAVPVELVVEIDGVEHSRKYYKVLFSDELRRIGKDPGGQY